MKNKFYNVLLALVLCMGAFLMPMEAHAQGAPDTEETSPASASVDPEAEGKELAPFTPEGQASVVDHATDGDGKEFYTFSTPEGNVFYLVIDRQRDSDNVYFLNAVTEADLMALAESGSGERGVSESAIPEIKVCICRERCAEGWADVSCPVCRENPVECKGKVAQAQPSEEGGETQPEKKESSGNSSTIVFVLLAVAAVGGVGYYLKIYKPRHDLDDAEDLDELLDDSGQEVNEDEGAEPVRETEWNPGGREKAETYGAEAAGMESGEDAALYDDYPDDNNPGGPDDMQEG